MIITIIAEPRSGSTNLTNWFFTDKDFTILFEPISNPNTKWYKNGLDPKDWKYETKHLLIKEVFNNTTDFKEIIDISDKVICLFREDETKQMESYYNAVKTKNWHTVWAFKKNKLVINEDEHLFFKNLKIKFKENYLTNQNYLKVSYEDLYYNNKIQIILDYIGDNKLIRDRFPYGEKYRVDVTDREKYI